MLIGKLEWRRETSWLESSLRNSGREVSWQRLDDMKRRTWVEDGRCQDVKGQFEDLEMMIPEDQTDWSRDQVISRSQMRVVQNILDNWKSHYT